MKTMKKKHFIKDVNHFQLDITFKVQIDIQIKAK